MRPVQVRPKPGRPHRRRRAVGVVVAGRGLAAWCCSRPRVLAVWWARTRETRTTTYRVLGDLAGIRLDVGDADVEIDGGAAAIEVRRIDRFAFGAPSDEDRRSRTAR